jgi:hypothetical protein
MSTVHARLSWRWVRVPLIVAICVGAAPFAQAADLSGCWEGCWKSCTTGHKGVLRATITKLDDSRYCAHFSGTFFRFIPFRYTTVLNAVDNGDSVALSGSSYLGRLMGTFCYDGTANECQFNMNYRSRNDCGVFRMSRYAQCCE